MTEPTNTEQAQADLAAVAAEIGVNPEDIILVVRPESRGCSIDGGASDASSQCADITAEAEQKKIDVDDVLVDIQRITDLINELNAMTDCDSIKLKLKITGDELNSLLGDLQAEAQEIIKTILPQMAIPAPTPPSILGWVKKNVIGDVLPYIEAYIKILLAVVELSDALAAFAQTMQNIIPKLQACALSLLNEQLACAGVPINAQQLLGAISSGAGTANFKEQLIAQLVDQTTTKIAGEIADTICGSGLAADISAIGDAIGVTKSLINSIDNTIASTAAVMDSTLSSLGAAGGSIEAATGVPFTVNTSSTAAFTASIEAGDYDATKASAAVLLAMEPPTNNTAPTVGGSAVVGSTLTVNVGTWNGPNIAYSYVWYRNDEPLWSANTETLQLTTAEEGFTIKCQVDATNPVGASSVISAETSVVVFAPPSASVDPVITGTAAVGSTLGVSDGTWADSPTIEYQWQWAHVSANIYNATANSYVVNQEDVGRTLTCLVIATTNSGVTQKRPTPTAIVSGNVTVNGTLTVTQTTNTANLNVTSTATLVSVRANNSLGLNNRTLHSNGNTVYWD